MGMPQWLSGSKQWGPPTWAKLHATMEAIPCEGCRQVGIRAMRGLHDVVNLELEKTVRYPQDLLFLQKLVEEAVVRCRGIGSCPGKRPCQGTSCPGRK